MCNSYVPIQAQLLRDVFGVTPPDTDYPPETWPAGLYGPNYSSWPGQAPGRRCRVWAVRPSLQPDSRRC